jgi:hypothetical protein
MFAFNPHNNTVILLFPFYRSEDEYFGKLRAFSKSHNQYLAEPSFEY